MDLAREAPGDDVTVPVAVHVRNLRTEADASPGGDGRILAVRLEEGHLGDCAGIEGLVDRENSKCKRALEKINFVHEGTLREYEIKDGRNVDLDIYAILKKDWK